MRSPIPGLMAMVLLVALEGQAPAARAIAIDAAPTVPPSYTREGGSSAAEPGVRAAEPGGTTERPLRRSAGHRAKRRKARKPRHAAESTGYQMVTPQPTPTADDRTP